MDPRKIGPDELQRLRTEVAQARAIDLYDHYAEPEAAERLRLDVSTVKRNRRAGRVPYVSYGNGGVRFMGVMLCDYILFGERAVLLWGAADTTSGSTSSASSGSDSVPKAPPGIVAGARVGGPAALASAQRTVQRLKRG